MKSKFKVLRIIGSIDPRFGGPSAGIIESSLTLIKRGFEVHILTADPKKAIFFKSNKIKIINKGPHILGNYYFSLKQFFWLRQNRDRYDAFIVHGLWQFKTLIARILLKKKYFVFTHGQLDPFFAENFFRMIKKKIYWFFIEKRNLLNAKSLLLTSEGEKNTLKKTFVNTDGIKKQVIKYGILKKKINREKLLKQFYSQFPFLKHNNFYLFLGRFHEKKGCDIVIKSINKLKNKFNNKILFIGPMTGSSYEVYIKNLVKKYNLQQKIFFSNALFGDLKWGPILACKGMLLASHGENFGISLVESLSMGKPVITTDKVNIYKDILKYKAGFISKDNVNNFSKALQKFNSLTKKQTLKMSKNSYRCFNENFNLQSRKNSLDQLLKKNIKKINE